MNRAKSYQYQRGNGAYTLCQQCNNLTGVWYAAEFIEFVYQGMSFLQQANQEPSLEYPFHFYPLQVYKQILCMFLSTNSPEFSKTNLQLRKIVLEKDGFYIPSQFKIYLFYCVGNRMRQTNYCGKLNVFDRSQNSFFSEIAWPPFGYVMASEAPPDDRMLDITHWGQLRYNQFRSWYLKVPVLPVYSYFPGDYRDEADIEKAVTANQERMEKSKI